MLARSHKVQIEHEGKQYDLEVPDGKTILEVALDKGLDLPHDCKLGVCMTCPAKLVSEQRQAPAQAYGHKGEGGPNCSSAGVGVKLGWV